MVQVSSLIYSRGIQAENIYSSFVFDTDDDKNDYDIVLCKFDEYFVPKKNVIHERLIFQSRDQKEGENVESFVRSL